MMAINAFLFLILGYVLVRKLKHWGKLIGYIIWSTVLVEIGKQIWHYNDHTWYQATWFVADQEPFPQNVFIN